MAIGRGISFGLSVILFLISCFGYLTSSERARKKKEEEEKKMEREREKVLLNRLEGVVLLHNTTHANKRALNFLYKL